MTTYSMYKANGELLRSWEFPAGTTIAEAATFLYRRYFGDVSGGLKPAFVVKGKRAEYNGYHVQ